MKKLVRESLNPAYNKLISVDIQPGHLDHIHFDLYSFVEYLEEFDDILYLFNGEELEYDSLQSVKDFLIDNGATEELIDRITFMEKSYGFFRGGMDTNVDEDELIEIIEYMIENGVNSSEEIDFNELPEIDEETIDSLNIDSIFLPEFNLDIVRRYDNSIIVGGSYDECLAEMKILFEAMGLDYKENQRFIY